MTPSTPVLVVLALLVALLLTGMILRPWLVFLPVIVAASWVRGLFAIPTNINKALAFSALEKDSAALEHYANVALALKNAGPEFRAAAREAFARIAAGYGFHPDDAHGEADEIPANAFPSGKLDPFAAQTVGAAAEAMNRTKPGAIKPGKGVHPIGKSAE